uniref:Uncharacterized protein n=1 Tax=Oryza sativa subsp. japonica TaxID=39947 RepID=Q5Z8W5_ORYSJ|nr:hypothetical protein [Oryza sativa Japonica Group]
MAHCFHYVLASKNLNITKRWHAGRGVAVDWWFTLNTPPVIMVDSTRGIARGGLRGGGGGGLRAVGSGGRRGAAAFVGAGEEPPGAMAHGVTGRSSGGGRRRNSLPPRRAPPTPPRSALLLGWKLRMAALYAEVSLPLEEHAVLDAELAGGQLDVEAVQTSDGEWCETSTAAGVDGVEVGAVHAHQPHRRDP